MGGKLKRRLQQHGLTGLFRRAVLSGVRAVNSRSRRLVERMEFSTDASTIYRQQKPLLAENVQYRNKHQGKRCFIIGNGPSAGTQDLTCLAHDITLVTNAFWTHPAVDTWQPTYYFLTDPQYFDPEFRPTMTDFFQQLTAKVQSSTFFVPANFREMVQASGFLPPEQTRYAAMAGSLTEELDWEPDLTQVLPGVRNVIQLAIMAAMYMGCSPIYLLGLDHDWLSHRGTDRHFYRGQIPYDKRLNARVDWCGYGELMEYILVTWRGYESIRRVAESKSLKILNATNGGFLDVFERVDYSSIFPQASNKSQQIA
jgi:hypothetical protein